MAEPGRLPLPLLLREVLGLPSGGDEQNRTVDPLLARQVLSQLSYTPICESPQSTPARPSLAAFVSACAKMLANTFSMVCAFGFVRRKIACAIAAPCFLRQLCEFPHLFGLPSFSPPYAFVKVPLSRALKIKQRIDGLSVLILELGTTPRGCSGLHRKEVIQPHLPIRLPCYDLTPVANPTFGSALLAVRQLTSGITGSHGLTGGVYKARERIHRGMLIRDY